MSGPFYPLPVEVEGRRYAGTWSLKQGGRLRVSWPNGSRLVDLGPRDRPEDLAPLILTQMIELWLAGQRKPLPPIKRPRRR